MNETAAARTSHRAHLPAWLALAASGLLGAWFGLLAWLGHAPRDLPRDWLGLWAGDRKDHPDLILAAENWSQTVGSTGTAHPGKPLTDEADPAYYLRRGEGIHLGRWNPRDVHRWTMSVWVRVGAGTTSATNFVTLAGGVDRRQPWCLGLSNGHPAFRLNYRHPTRENQPIVLPSPQPLPTGEWAQLTAVYAQPYLRLYVNGRPVAARRDARDLLLAREVWLGSASGDYSTRPIVTLDDFVVFSRALSVAEVTTWHEASRGRAMTLHERRAWHVRLAERGTPWVLGLAAALGLLTVLPWLANQVFGGLRELAVRPLRAVRWTLLTGGVVTVVLTGLVLRAGRKADRLNLELIAETFGQATDSHLERVADLLLRAREQMAARPEITPAQFEAWVRQNHFPHDHPGLHGLGVALRVEESGLAEFERNWTVHHTNGYAVSPRLPDEERVRWHGWPAPPRLPVVMNVVSDWGHASQADRTQLGRDLLALRAGEEDVGGQFASLRAITGRPGTRSCGLVEISGAEFGGTAREGIRLFASFHRPPPEGQTASGSRDWAGVVFASVDLRHLLQTYWRDHAPLVGVRLVTGTDGVGYPSKEAIGADLGELFPERARPARPYLEHEVKLRVYSRRIWAQFWTTSAFDAQSHRRWPWITASVGVMVTILTAGLLAMQVRARLRQEADAAELRAANAALAEAQAERLKLGRDLHDGAIQSLYALQLGFSRTAEQTAATQPELGARLAEHKHSLSSVIGELRGFILRYEADDTPASDLEGVLRTTVQRLQNTTTAQLTVQTGPDAARLLSGDQAVQLANIAREALSNSLRHSEARAVEVRLTRNDAMVTLEVCDDGCGFDPAHPPRSGMGLKSMRVRSEEAGGNLTIDSAPGCGTRVRVVLPCSAGESEV